MNYYPPQPAPPRKGMSGCAIAALVFLVLGVIGFGACVVCVAVAGHRSPAEKARDNAIAASASAEAAKEKAELDARFRKECGVKDGGLIFPIYDRDLKDQCHAQIREGLRVPGSEEFPDDSDRGLVSDDGCNRIFKSTFTAKNAFGVAVRNSYACTYDPRTGLTSVHTD